MKDDALSYHAKIVKENDPDRFLMAMLLPEEKREDIWALFAFNYEIAKTREVVSDTTIGLIRLQWWRDGLKAYYEEGSVSKHETLSALIRIAQQYGVSQDDYEALIFGREFDLEDVLPASWNGFCKYAEFTNLPLNKMVLKVLGDNDSEESMSQVSILYGVVGLLRSVPFHAIQDRCYLPEDMMAEYSVSLGSLYALKPENGITELINDIADKLAKEFADMSPHSYFMNIQKQMAVLYLKQLKSCGFDPLHQRMVIAPPFFHLRLLWSLRPFRNKNS